ncbi:MAG: hypothetical protein MUQ10_15940 [Anaerolineae bacterium]|nr:hypothetical protein [Anaerolineae bacterium]
MKSSVGNERLTGFRIESLNGGDITSLNVDGVFLKIGLSPNREPVRDVAELNAKFEITVNSNR